MCDDLDLPSACASLIAAAMDEQITECAPFAEFYPIDRRVLIKLEVAMWTSMSLTSQLLVGKELLTDQFEWEICKDNSPEQFAEIMCADLGLGGEYEVRIAHAIREQVVQALRVCCCFSLLG